MDTISNAQSIINKSLKLLPDDAKKDFMTQTGISVDAAIGNAAAMVNKNPEKETLLKAYAVQEANRIITVLWREQILTPELEKEYRELPSMKELAEAYNAFVDDRKARMDKVMEQHRAIADEEKELDIFKGVINGMTKQESEAKYKEYQQKTAKAMQQGA